MTYPHLGLSPDERAHLFQPNNKQMRNTLSSLVLMLALMIGLIAFSGCDVGERDGVLKRHLSESVSEYVDSAAKTGTSNFTGTVTVTFESGETFEQDVDLGAVSDSFLVGVANDFETLAQYLNTTMDVEISVNGNTFAGYVGDESGIAPEGEQFVALYVLKISAKPVLTDPPIAGKSAAERECWGTGYSCPTPCNSCALEMECDDEHTYQVCLDVYTCATLGHNCQ